MGFLDPNSWANALDTSAEKGAEQARNMDYALKQQALQLAREQYEYQKALNRPFYDRGLPAFYTLADAITGDKWSPKTTSAYKWQERQMDQNLGRKLRSMGRGNSTFGARTLSDAYQNIASSEYDKQLGRLADLTNIARGGASTLTGASGHYQNLGSGMLNNLGDNMANSYLAQGAIGGGGLGGLSGLGQLGLSLYDYGKQNNWWGGGGGGYGSLWNDAGGDINNVDFESGGGWGEGWD